MSKFVSCRSNVKNSFFKTILWATILYTIWILYAVIYNNISVIHATSIKSVSDTNCRYKNVDQFEQTNNTIKYNNNISRYNKCQICKFRKIFLMGFPKCGTLSIHHMLNSIGCKSFHFSWRESQTTKREIRNIITGYNDDNNITYNFLQLSNNKFIAHCGYMMELAFSQNLSLLHYFPERYNVFTQMEVCKDEICIWPQMIYYKLLFEQYPNSLFILPFRNISNHINSINHWGHLREKLINHDIPGLPKGVGEKDEDLKEWIMDHYCKIDSFFQQNAPTQFLKINIENMEQELPKIKSFLNCQRLSIKQHHKTNFTEKKLKNITWAYKLANPK